jgi:hypothetical protein
MTSRVPNRISGMRHRPHDFGDMLASQFLLFAEKRSNALNHLRDWNPSPPPAPKYPVDLSRMPKSEPAPFYAAVHENTWKRSEGTVRIERHFTMGDSSKCQRCWHCSAVERCHLTTRESYMKCEVTVPEANVDTVLNSPTPVEQPMFDTEVKLNRATSLNISVPFPGSTISGPYWVDLIVMTRKAWKRSVCSEDRSWSKRSLLGGRLVLALKWAGNAEPKILNA